MTDNVTAEVNRFDSKKRFYVHLRGDENAQILKKNQNRVVGLTLSGLDAAELTAVDAA